MTHDENGFDQPIEHQTTGACEMQGAAAAPLRRKISVIVVGIVAAIVVWLSVRHYVGEQAHQRAAAVVGELGGQCGSIPFEPIGTEVRISFKKKSLTREQLSRLNVLNSLPSRHQAGIEFVDTNLSPEDLRWLHEQIPHVALRLYRDDKMIERIVRE
jgi:hypothetical protein